METQRRISTKDIILDITSMQKFAKKLIGKGKDYEELLLLLMAEDYGDPDIPIPSVSQLQEQLKVNYTTFRKLLMGIYNDLYNHEQINIDFNIEKVEYIFSMSYFDRNAQVTLNELPVLPRVGEEITLPFFKAKLDFEWFHVNSIHHYISDRKQVVFIRLHPCGYNLYWHIRKDKALLKGEISSDDYYDHMDSDNKQKLGLRRW